MSKMLALSPAYMPEYHRSSWQSRTKLESDKALAGDEKASQRDTDLFVEAAHLGKVAFF